VDQVDDFAAQDFQAFLAVLGPEYLPALSG
jgi:hypothetical protein